MENHSCKTYFALCFKFDTEKNAELLFKRRDCEPEEIGIYRKSEAERAIAETLGVIPEWRRHKFVIGYNERYDTDANEMIRVTLRGLLGKEDKIREICERFSLSAVLEIVPCIVRDSSEPKQYLSLERDIVEFLYKSGAGVDLDYYVS